MGATKGAASKLITGILGKDWNHGRFTQALWACARAAQSDREISGLSVSMTGSTPGAPSGSGLDFVTAIPGVNGDLYSPSDRPDSNVTAGAYQV